MNKKGPQPGTRKALAMLRKTVCNTASSTYGDSTISGSIASQLVKDGLAVYVGGWQVGQRGALTRVKITEEGRALCDAAEIGVST